MDTLSVGFVYKINIHTAAAQMWNLSWINKILFAHDPIIGSTSLYVRNFFSVYVKNSTFQSELISIEIFHINTHAQNKPSAQSSHFHTINRISAYLLSLWW